MSTEIDNLDEAVERLRGCIADSKDADKEDLAILTVGRGRYKDCEYGMPSGWAAYLCAHRVLDLLAELPHCHGPSYDWRSKMLEFGTPNYPAGIIHEGELPKVTLAAVTCAEFISWRKTQ